MSVVGRHEGRVFDDRPQVSFTLGEGLEQDIPDGVEVALQKMKKQERSVLTLAPRYAFGAAGHAAFGVPPNAVVEYEVELKNFEKVNTVSVLEKKSVPKKGSRSFVKKTHPDCR